MFQLFFQTLFNPEGSVLQLIHIPYDFSDMPRSSRTFLRQKSIFNESKKLRYLIHLRLDFDIVNIISNENITQKFQFTIKWSIFSTWVFRIMSSSKGTKLFLHGEIKVVFSSTYRMQVLNQEESITTVDIPNPKVEQKFFFEFSFFLFLYFD